MKFLDKRVNRQEQESLTLTLIIRNGWTGRKNLGLSPQTSGCYFAAVLQCSQKHKLAVLVRPPLETTLEV